MAIGRLDLTAAVHATGEHRGELTVGVAVEIDRHGEARRLDECEWALAKLHAVHHQPSTLQTAADELKRRASGEPGHECAAYHPG